MAFAQSQGPGQQPLGGWHEADTAMVAFKGHTSDVDPAVKGTSDVATRQEGQGSMSLHAAGSSGGASASVPPAAAAAAGSAPPAQQQTTQQTQADPPAGGGGGSGGAAAGPESAMQQGDDKQDEDEELARAIQNSMDDASN